jgi:hypothetical protein
VVLSLRLRIFPTGHDGIVPAFVNAVGYRIAVVVATAAIVAPAMGGAQTTTTPATDTYPRFETTEEVKAPVAAPLTRQERIEWIIDGIAGPRNVQSAALSETIDSLWNTPKDDSRAATIARRLMNHELNVAIARSVEGGLGTLWGEDPRPRHLHKETTWPRIQHAMESVVLAPRVNGQLGPAWGRMAGTVAAGVAANAWLPAEQRSPQDTAFRIADALVSRLIGNLWDEFWPDIRTKLPPVPQPFWRNHGDR